MINDDTNINDGYDFGMQFMQIISCHCIVTATIVDTNDDDDEPIRHFVDRRTAPVAVK